MIDPLLIFIMFLFFAAYVMLRISLKFVFEFLKQKKKDKEIQDKPIKKIEW